MHAAAKTDAILSLWTRAQTLRSVRSPRPAQASREAPREQAVPSRQPAAVEPARPAAAARR
jgi:hypothetical protein